MNSLNLSNWTYQIKQIGAGLYVLQGVGGSVAANDLPR